MTRRRKPVPPLVPKRRREVPAGHLYQRGRRWWWKVRFPGDSAASRIPLKPRGSPWATRDKAVAAYIARQLWQTRVGGEKPRDTAALLATFRQASALESSKGQAAHNAAAVRAFLDHARIDPQEITAAAVQDHLGHLSQLGRAPATIINHRHALSRFCEFLRLRGLLDSNPARQVRPPRRTLPPPRFLDDQQVACLLDLARAHGLYTEVVTALYTGMRLSELRRLTWRDVRPDRIVVLISKTGKPRAIPLHPKVAKALAALPRGRPAELVFRRPSHMTWLRAFRPIAKAMPIFGEAEGARVGRGWHLLRHTFASRAVQRGIDLRTVAEWMGHLDLRTTMRYAHLAPGHGAEQISRL